ncbi:hypothetical protein DFJ74DRAFT_764051 [Hyaloraphidium curvatum]|nr:hypothetical protein DFJ74DRAFT_764051 [Hyaloraphidium curvatum]
MRGACVGGAREGGRRDRAPRGAAGRTALPPPAGLRTLLLLALLAAGGRSSTVPTLLHESPRHAAPSAAQPAPRGPRSPPAWPDAQAEPPLPPPPPACATRFRTASAHLAAYAPPADPPFDTPSFPDPRDVVAASRASRQPPLTVSPALFGYCMEPGLPVWGSLVSFLGAADGCRPLPLRAEPGPPRIAVLGRGNCSFAAKASRCAAAGYGGMLVLDRGPAADGREGYLFMDTDGRGVPDPGIAAALAQDDAAERIEEQLMLAAATETELAVVFFLDPHNPPRQTRRPESPWPPSDNPPPPRDRSFPPSDTFWPPSHPPRRRSPPFALASALLPLVTLLSAFTSLLSLALLLLAAARTYRRTGTLDADALIEEFESAASRALRGPAMRGMSGLHRLPLRPHPGGDSGAEGCPICLDDYPPSSLVRELPCGHFFHAACVDPWLAERNGVCPCCKADVEGMLEAHGRGLGWRGKVGGWWREVRRTWTV